MTWLHVLIEKYAITKCAVFPILLRYGTNPKQTAQAVGSQITLQHPIKTTTTSQSGNSSLVQIQQDLEGSHLHVFWPDKQQ